MAWTLNDVAPLSCGLAFAAPASPNTQPNDVAPLTLEAQFAASRSPTAQPKDVAPLSLATAFSSPAVADTTKPHDIAPLSLGAQFAASAAPWSRKYFGGPLDCDFLRTLRMVVGAASTYNRIITVPHTLIPSDQTDFVVPVKMTDATLKHVSYGGRVQSLLGYDIHFFTDATKATKLKWEMDFYDPVNGTVVAHVKRTVTSAVDATFCMTYGDPAITTDQSDKANTWSNGFTSIYHFGDGTTLSVADALAANNGTNYGCTAVAGKLGGGLHGDGSSQYALAKNGPIIDAASAWTVSAWIRTTAGGTPTDRTIYAERSASGTDILKVGGFHNSPPNFFVILMDDHVNYQFFDGATTINDGNWHHVVAVRDGSTIRLYVDGASDMTPGSYSSTDFTDSGRESRVALDPSDGFSVWDGDIDELRISVGAARSADWIAAEYNLVQTGVTIGSEFQSPIYAVTGRAVALSKAHGALSISQGSYTVTGEAMILLRPRIVAPVSASYALSSGIPDGTLVDKWIDQSHHGNDATASGSARPTFKVNILNGKPVLRTTSGTSEMDTPTVLSSQPMTIIVVAKLTSVGVANHVIDSPIAAERITFGLTGSGYVELWAGTSLTGVTNFSGAFHVFTGIYNSTSSKIFVDGTQDGSTGDVGTFANCSLQIGISWTGDIAAILIYDSVLSSTDRANVEKALGSKYNISVAGGTAVDPNSIAGLKLWLEADTLQGPVMNKGKGLSGAQGSLALTGEAVGLLQGRKVPLTQGSYALTGEAATLARSRPITLIQGSYTLTGEALALKIGHLISVTQGSYTFIGEAVALLRGYPISLNQGSYALTGEALALKIGHLISLAQGSYTLTGEAVALLRGYPVSLNQGSYVLTGEDVALFYSAPIAIGTGIFTLTGEDVILSHVRTLAAAQGAFALTGKAVTFLRPRIIFLAQRQFVLTRQDQSLLWGRNLAAAQGAFALTGEANLLFGRNIFMARGSYALTGEAVAFSTPLRLFLAQRQFVFTGGSANLLFGRNLAATQGAFGLTGEAANPLFGRKANMAQGSYALAGETIALLRSRISSLAQGAFALTGENVNLSHGLFVPLGHGSFSLSGEDLKYLLDRNIIAAFGAFVLTGHGVALIFRPLFAPSDILLVNARAATSMALKAIADPASLLAIRTAEAIGARAKPSRSMSVSSRADTATEIDAKR